jgi:hypothetical protein
VSEDLVRNFLYSLRVERIAVLVNKPGTDKTEFVKAFVRCLGRALTGTGSDGLLVDVAVSEEFAEHGLSNVDSAKLWDADYVLRSARSVPSGRDAADLGQARRPARRGGRAPVGAGGARALGGPVAGIVSEGVRRPVRTPLEREGRARFMDHR